MCTIHRGGVDIKFMQSSQQHDADTRKPSFNQALLMLCQASYGVFKMSPVFTDNMNTPQTPPQNYGNPLHIGGAAKIVNPLEKEKAYNFSWWHYFNATMVPFKVHTTPWASSTNRRFVSNVVVHNTHALLPVPTTSPHSPCRKKRNVHEGNTNIVSHESCWPVVFCQRAGITTSQIIEEWHIIKKKREIHPANEG